MSEQKSYEDYRDEVLLDLLMDELFGDCYISNYDEEPKLRFQISTVADKIIALMRPKRCETKLAELIAQRDAKKKEQSDES